MLANGQVGYEGAMLVDQCSDGLNMLSWLTCGHVGWLSGLLVRCFVC